VTDWEHSVAISMPGVEANTSNVDGLSPKSATKGNANETSFLNVLTVAGLVQGDSDGLEVAEPGSPASSTKLLRQNCSNLNIDPAGSKHVLSSTPNPIRSGLVNKTGAKPEGAHSTVKTPPALLTKETTANLTVTIPDPATTPLPITNPAAVTGLSDRQITSTRFGISSTVTRTTDVPVTAKGGPTAATSKQPLPAKGAVALGARQRDEERASDAAEQAETPKVAGRAASHTMLATHSALSTDLGEGTGTATFALADDFPEPSARAQVDSPDPMIGVARPALVFGRDARHAIATAELPAPDLAAPMLTSQIPATDVQSLLSPQGQQNAGRTAKSDSRVATGHQVPREPSRAPQVQKEFKQTTTVTGATTHVPQHALAPKADADEHAVAPVGPTPLTTVKGAQQSSVSNSRGNNAGQRGKRELEPAAQVIGTKADPEFRSSMEAKASSGANVSAASAAPRNNISEVVAPQPATATMMQENSPAHMPGNSNQANDGGPTQLRNTQDVDAEHQSLAGVPGAVHSARLVNQAGQSELRVGFKAGEFGNVDIRTLMVHSRVTAEISVEHGELRNLLATELPHLQEKLAENPLTPANVMLSNYAGGSSPGSRNAYQQNAHHPQNSNARDNGPQASPASTLLDQYVPSTQLDVHI